MEGSRTLKKPWMSPLFLRGYYLVDGRQLCIHGLSAELGALLSNKDPWECLWFEMYYIPVKSCQSIRISNLFIFRVYCRFPYEILIIFIVCGIAGRGYTQVLRYSIWFFTGHQKSSRIRKSLVNFRGASFQPAVTYGYHGSILMIVWKKTLEVVLLGTLLPTVMLKQRFKGL